MSKIYIDLDDTVVEFLEGVCKKHNKLHPENPVKKEELDDWHRNGEFIKPYIQEEGLYLNLKIKDKAISTLRKLSLTHDVCILTAFPTAQSAKEKVEFVEKHLPFIGIENLTLTWDKGALKGDLLFDDSPTFLPSFEGVKVAFDQTYNQDTEVDYRVNSWDEFYEVIKELEDLGKLQPNKRVNDAKN